LLLVVGRDDSGEILMIDAKPNWRVLDLFFPVPKKKRKKRIKLSLSLSSFFRNGGRTIHPSARDVRPADYGHTSDTSTRQHYCAEQVNALLAPIDDRWHRVCVEGAPRSK
jgi:hypothetical protein